MQKRNAIFKAYRRLIFAITKDADSECWEAKLQDLVGQFNGVNYHNDRRRLIKLSAVFSNMTPVQVQSTLAFLPSDLDLQITVRNFDTDELAIATVMALSQDGAGLISALYSLKDTIIPAAIRVLNDNEVLCALLEKAELFWQPEAMIAVIRTLQEPNQRHKMRWLSPLFLRHRTYVGDKLLPHFDEQQEALFRGYGGLAGRHDYLYFR